MASCIEDAKLVSVIVPCFNAEGFIEETVRSVLQQDYPNIEIIVVDDGSTDNSRSILTSYQEKGLIKLICQPNQGASAAKQTGIDACTGDYIQYLDADDLLSPNKIAVQIEALKGIEDAVCISKTRFFFDGNNHLSDYIEENANFYSKYLDEPFLFLLRLYGGIEDEGSMIQPNAFLVPKSVIDKAGKWNTSISPCPDEDGEYFCRVILNSKRLIYVPAGINYYRKFSGAKSLSSIRNERAVENLIEAILLRDIHMRDFCRENNLQKKISRTTYRSLHELMVDCYITHPRIYNKLAKILPKFEEGRIEHQMVLGSSFINFVANNISWKLARSLQYYCRKAINSL